MAALRSSLIASSRSRPASFGRLWGGGKQGSRCRAEGEHKSPRSDGGKEIRAE